MTSKTIEPQTTHRWDRSSEGDRHILWGIGRVRVTVTFYGGSSGISSVQMLQFNLIKIKDNFYSMSRINSIQDREGVTVFQPFL